MPSCRKCVMGIDVTESRQRDMLARGVSYDVMCGEAFGASFTSRCRLCCRLGRAGSAGVQGLTVHFGTCCSPSPSLLSAFGTRPAFIVHCVSVPPLPEHPRASTGRTPASLPYHRQLLRRVRVSVSCNGCSRHVEAMAERPVSTADEPPCVHRWPTGMHSACVRLILLPSGAHATLHRPTP